MCSTGKSFIPVLLRNVDIVRRGFPIGIGLR
jgi:hypothetical protein